MGAGKSVVVDLAEGVAGAVKRDASGAAKTAAEEILSSGEKLFGSIGNDIAKSPLATNMGIGATAGAVWGAVSDDDSILGSALVGAGLGIAASGLRTGIEAGFKSEKEGLEALWAGAKTGAEKGGESFRTLGNVINNRTAEVGEAFVKDLKAGMEGVVGEESVHPFISRMEQMKKTLGNLNLKQRFTVYDSEYAKQAKAFANSNQVVRLNKRQAQALKSTGKEHLAMSSEQFAQRAFGTSKGPFAITASNQATQGAIFIDPRMMEAVGYDVMHPIKSNIKAQVRSIPRRLGNLSNTAY